MASPKGAYSPKTGPLAGQSYTSYYAYQNARAQVLGYKSYTEQRNTKLQNDARENLMRIFPTYPKSEADRVMRGSQRQLKLIRDAGTIQDFYENDLGVDTEVYYHD